MANNRTYEEYEPAVEWSRSAEADAVKLWLQGKQSIPWFFFCVERLLPLKSIAGAAGFKREDIRVLVDNHGHLRTRGERPIVANRWSRFHKDFELPANCNADGIRAKFENERLTITLPKNAPSPPMPAPPRRPPMPAPPQMLPPPPPAVPEPAARPTGSPPTVPAAPFAPAPSVKPPVEPRPSMPRKPYAPVPAPAPAPPPEVEQLATTKPQSPLGAVSRPKEEVEKQMRKREEEGKMAEDRKQEMVQDQKATEQQQKDAILAEMALVNQPSPASASRGLLVNVAVVVVVLLGITVYVWHSLRNATGGAGEHGHGHMRAGSYRDEM
ncbi:unnamed protein product [Miscanthus lutarioriparius]|uniref:SHSP domain-containing protein n=1 Tax=Miscanthus lutarioriparius TaxID=422564 RepID=A0A811MIM3_9POAL|nr:unnamed protein product [Miscanthus lutarioriparius]